LTIGSARAATSSSTFRRETGKRTYSMTVGLMTSGRLWKDLMAIFLVIEKGCGTDLPASTTSTL